MRSCNNKLQKPLQTKTVVVKGLKIQVWNHKNYHDKNSEDKQ